MQFVVVHGITLNCHQHWAVGLQCASCVNVLQWIVDWCALYKCTVHCYLIRNVFAVAPHIHWLCVIFMH